MIRPIILLAVTLLILSTYNLGSGQDDGVAILAPEPILIQVENGIGSTQVVFTKKAGLERPQFKVTDAIGPNNSIGEKEISFEWVNNPPKDERAVLIAKISVKTQPFTESSPYKGRVVLFWPGTQQAEKPQILTQAGHKPPT